MHSALRVHTYRLLVPHPDVSDAHLLGSKGDFGHRDAYDAKHVIHILGAKNRGMRPLKGKPPAKLPPARPRRFPVSKTTSRPRRLP